MPPQPEPAGRGRALRPPRMRPVFELSSLAGREAVMNALARQLTEEKGNVEGVVIPTAVDLWIPVEQATFWSPVLALSIDDDPGGGCRVRGRFGPQDHVWTFFMAVYGLIVLAGVCALMWGVSEWTLGREPWTLLGVPAAAGLFAFVYGATIIGQGLGADQMYQLRRFVERAAEEAAP